MNRDPKINFSAVKTLFTGSQDSYSVETLAEAVRFVYQNKKSHSIKMTLNILFIVCVLWNTVDNGLLVSWFVFMLVIRGLSYWQASYFLTQQLSDEETLKWGQIGRAHV